jgi:hypothetical protein
MPENPKVRTRISADGIADGAIDITKLSATAVAAISSASHTHGNITNVGAIGSTANLPLITTTSGVITVGSFGTTANTFCQGNDGRLSDARAPTSHTHGNITNAGAIGSTSGQIVVTTTSGVLTTAATISNTQVSGLGAMATSSGITLTGDVTGSGTGSFAATLSNSGVTAGTYRSVTVDAKGRVTAGTNPTTLAGYGITDAVTSGGSGATGTWAISISGSAAQLGGVAASNYFRVDGSYPNADMNAPVEGYWHVAPTASNLPDGARYGHRWDYDHAGDGSWVAQFYTPTDGDAGLWFRQRRGGTWQTWRKFLDSATYNSYSPTLTGGGASGTWSINVTGSAGSATTCTYQVGSGTANNFNTNFTETPAHNRAFREMSAGGPQGAWWFVENMRHSNATNYWGRQNAWGWEDNANELWSRNVQGGTWGSWVRFIHSGNYTSYAPTLTGGGASGTWGINVTGTANSETLSTVCSRGASTSSNITTTGAVYSSNWFRSNGASGWYSETYGGGIWMNDSTYVRVYADKQFYTGGAISSGTAMYAPIFYDSQNAAYYCDPNGTSRMAGMDIDSLQIFGNYLYVGKSDTAEFSYIAMRDSNEGERLIHCNSNRIGFLSQAGGWSAWSYDDGTFGCYGGTSRAIEAIGGWGSYGATLELRCDNWAGNGLQDGPRIWHHKAGVKSWTIGIQHAASNGFSINEDGSWGGFGTERLVIAPGGNITHNGVPGYFVRAWAYFYNANRYGSGNVSSITSRNATGKYRINFETPLPSGNPCCLGNVGNESDTIANTTMRMGVRSFASGARLATQDINIVISGGQGVPAASDAMIGCSFLAII